MLHDIKVFAGGPTDACDEQRRITTLISSQINRAFHSQCGVEAQFWDAAEEKTIADSEIALQNHIDKQPINAGNCDVYVF
jgi:hypothetical protein